eukprot:23878-Chlamydomonas_euryale.AAC.4
MQSHSTPAPFDSTPAQAIPKPLTPNVDATHRPKRAVVHHRAATKRLFYELADAQQLERAAAVAATALSADAPPQPQGRASVAPDGPAVKQPQQGPDEGLTAYVCADGKQAGFREEVGVGKQAVVGESVGVGKQAVVGDSVGGEEQAAFEELGLADDGVDEGEGGLGNVDDEHAAQGPNLVGDLGAVAALAPCQAAVGPAAPLLLFCKRLVEMAQAPGSGWGVCPRELQDALTPGALACGMGDGVVNAETYLVTWDEFFCAVMRVLRR